MLDAICLLAPIAFFGFLIYSTVYRHDPRRGVPPLPKPPAPSPVGLYCSICHEHADVVSSEEYARLSAAGVPVYCHWCMITIEAYKQQQARS